MIPVDNLFATPIFARHVRKKLKAKKLYVLHQMLEELREQEHLENFNVGLAIVDKRRPKPGQSQVMNVIGDVKDKTCIIVDDIIDSRRDNHQCS